MIRAALWARGWVERRLAHAAQRAPHCHGDEEEDGDDGDVSGGETMYLKRIQSQELPNETFILTRMQC